MFLLYGSRRLVHFILKFDVKASFKLFIWHVKFTNLLSNVSILADNVQVEVKQLVIRLAEHKTSWIKPDN